MRRRPRARPRAAALLVLAAALLPACGTPTGRLETPAERGRAGTPLGRSAHLRSGTLSWRLGAVERRERGVRVDLVLQNGTARHFDHLLLRVAVHGRASERASVRLPVGGLRAGRSHRVSARLPEVPFRVRDVRVELLASTP